MICNKILRFGGHYWPGDQCGWTVQVRDTFRSAPSTSKRARSRPSPISSGARARQDAKNGLPVDRHEATTPIGEDLVRCRGSTEARPWPMIYGHRPPPKSLTFDSPSPLLPHSFSFPMPGGSIDLQRTLESSSKPDAVPPKCESALLHRTPWTPPTAVRASGINIELEDGSQVIDAVGGAAVACLGMGNQKVMDAITSQLGNLICKSIHVLILFRFDKEQRDGIANHPGSYASHRG